MIHGSIDALEALLTLEAAGDNRFRGAQVADARSRVYGGQFLGQGLMAAARIGSGCVRSFHCYYLRPGTTDSPLTYTAAPIAGDLVSVRASQGDRVLFAMDVAFGEFDPVRAQPDPAMPQVPAPADCIPREAGIKGLDTNTDSTWAVIDSPFEYRFVENIWAEGYRRPGHHVWFRARDARPGGGLSQNMLQAMTAYFSDDPIMDNALFPHGWHHCWTALTTASLDHAMWFHAPVNLDAWLLFAQDSPVSWGGRAMTRGLIFDASGTRVASACQEILLRSPPPGST